MSSTKYFVSHDGVNMGPFEKSAINEKLTSSELKHSDYIYIEEKNQWVAISKHADFSEPSKTTETVVPSKYQWYVLKGKNRYGPFVYLDVIRMLQEKSVFEFDYVWRESFENWMRLAEVEDFTARRIKTLIDEDSDVSQVVHRRRHRRFSYECPLVAHDNAQVWKGKTLELSEGGAGIMMENALVLPGQNVYIHFKPGPTSKPFNVLCEVVSKKYSTSVKDKNSTVVYGVKFINIHKQDSEEIKTLQVAA